MQTKSLQQYRQKLVSMRERLRSEINYLSDNVCTDELPVGEHDRAVSEAIDKDLFLEQTEEGIHEQVAQALKRLDEGCYGVCQDCGGPIARARLEAIPYAAFCVRCQQQRES